MHDTALKIGKLFFDTYGHKHKEAHVLDIGSQDVNGSLKDVIKDGFKYTGLDFCEGKGVDVILEDPYIYPFKDNSFDLVVSSSCFEHSQLFWVSFLEAIRVVKPGGYFYLNVPSNGNFHRYPTDNWRFYPDSGLALVEWAKRNSVDMLLMESFVHKQESDIWNDFVAVFVKGQPDEGLNNKFIFNQIPDDVENIWHYGAEKLLKYVPEPEDKRNLKKIK